MSNCAECGAVLGIGRYCTNCGARADASAPQSPPQSPPPSPLPPAPLPGTGSRYPLYADEAVAAPPTADRAQRQDRRGGPPWLVLMLVVLLLAGIVGAWLVLRGDGDEQVAGGDPSSTPTTGPTTEPATGPTDAGRASPVTPDGRPRDLTKDVEVDAPRPAPAGQDFAGRRVSYPAGNLFDGQAQTAYRVTGDASGKVLTFTLPEARAVAMVGLVNGYAKTDRDRASGNEIDWYPRQHRITKVAWVFDDGTRIVQSLRMTRRMQKLSVSVETRTVEMHVLETRAPGDIPRARNATSISEVTLQGS